MSRKGAVMKTAAGVLLVTVLGVILVAFGQTSDQDEGDLPNAWLRQHVGERMVVIFDEPIPLQGRGVRSKLKQVEDSGIVMEWNNKDVFYTFSNILFIGNDKEVNGGLLVKEVATED